MMTETQEFLEKLAYPQREKITRHVNEWFNQLRDYDKEHGTIVDMKVISPRACHIVTITVSQDNQYVGIDLSFHLHFGNYKYAETGILSDSMCYEEMGEEKIYKKVYILREYI